MKTYLLNIKMMSTKMKQFLTFLEIMSVRLVLFVSSLNPEAASELFSG